MAATKPVVGLAALADVGGAVRRREFRSTACGSGSAPGAACLSGHRHRPGRPACRRAISNSTDDTTAANSGGVQALPDAAAQAFGDQQVALAVDPRQQPPVVGDLRICRRLAPASMNPRSVSSTTIRSNVRASEFVAAATFCRICSLSRSMRRYRSASRTCSSRSAQLMCGVAAHLAHAAQPIRGRRRVRRGRPLRLRFADGTSRPAAADRSAEATSRRTRGWRCSTRLGSVIDPSGADAPE